MENILLSCEEINRNAELERHMEKLIQQGYIDISNLIWKKQQLKEWDDTISDVEVATLWNCVLVKYSDGTIYKEDRTRFEAGKWTESILSEIFREAIQNMAKENERKMKRHRQKDYVLVFRDGDTRRVLKDDLRIIDAVYVNTEHEIIIMGQTEDGAILDVCRFYPDEIYIHMSEVIGNTLKDVGKIKEYKDRMYLRF